MTTAAPLSAAEETAWRAVVRALIAVPRALEADLVAGADLSMAEYAVLMHLSEAPDHQLRMTDLAARIALSPSRITRLVDGLIADGLVVRSRCPSDARGMLAVLSAAGLRRLEAAYPVHLASARRHVLDHLSGLDLAAFTSAVRRFAAPPDAETGSCGRGCA